METDLRVTARDLVVVIDSQLSVAVCTSGRRVSHWLPATAALTARQIHVSRGRKDAGLGVHFLSPGPL